MKQNHIIRNFFVLEYIMTSVFNYFNNLDKSENENNDNVRTYDSRVQIKNSSLDIPVTLRQGEQFKKYQAKIFKKYEKDIYKVNSKEGFQGSSNTKTHDTKQTDTKQTDTKQTDTKQTDTTQTDITQTDTTQTDTTQTNITQQSQQLLNQTQITPEQSQTFQNLKQQYISALKQYETIQKEIRDSTREYLVSQNPKNPYLGKNVKFTDNVLAYVTHKGVVKTYSKDIIRDTLGKNGCPSLKNTLPIRLAFSQYSTPGTVLPTKPILIVGTPMVSGQTCGNEGSSIFVDKMITNPSITYTGCYQDNTSGSSTMSFIGDAPPPAFEGLQNGNFEHPVIKNNSYQYITDSNKVPGWDFNAVIINSSKAWVYPQPYPRGPQAVSIQNTQSISQSIQLSSGSYTLSFLACGRDCCDNSNTSNPITIYVNSSSNSNNQIYDFTAPVSTWTNYSTTFSVPSSGSYTLVFQGTWSSSDRSTAIQNIQLSQSSDAGAGENGSYTYDSCKQSAIQGGYQYFALQNVNPANSLGYCGVSNNEPGITVNGTSYITTKQVSLWSSNTSDQTGNTATLNTSGSLNVLNSSGSSVFSTDNSKASPSNYLGCYGDRAKRALPLYNKGSQEYSLSQCQELAQQNGAAYFGLQNSTSGTNAQCAFGSSLSQAMEYGKANNCTKISDGSYSGGGWSNAVYNTNDPESNYFLHLQDNGNMCIGRGSRPIDNQGEIWCSETENKAQESNPNYTAAKGKYGQNWISSGDTLAAGDFVGSINGKIALIMQSDGNLVLYTFQKTENCSKMEDGNMGGGQFANAVYDIGQVGIPGNINQLGYVDANSNLYTYDSANIDYTSNYTEFSGNNPGNDISGAMYDNATVDQCKNSCNVNSECAGFVFDNSNNVCWPKNASIYPNSSLTPDTSSSNNTTYVRQKQPLTLPKGISKQMKTNSSIEYQNYVKGGSTYTNDYGLNSVTSVQQQQLEQIQSVLKSLAQQIENATGTFNENDILVNSQLTSNMQSVDQYLGQLNKIKKKIDLFDTNFTNILNDSDIVVLQENYQYMFWSILAVGGALIAMNVLKKSN